MHLVGYLYEDYHDARSLEHKVDLLCLPVLSARNNSAPTRRIFVKFDI
jgi:hypothetical protein